MPFIKANGIEFHVQEMNRGADKIIVLIHGMFANLSMYYFKIAPQLAKHYHVVMYDFRSHGMSQKAKTGFDLISLTDDLVSILDQLNVKSFYLAGYSYGAIVALKMTTRFPEKVNELIVIEAPNPGVTDVLEQTIDFQQLAEYAHGDNAVSEQKLIGKRQLEKYKRSFTQLMDESSAKQDMFDQKDFFKNNLIDRINQRTLLLYGLSSDCKDACNELYDKIPNSSALFLDGDHRLPIQHPDKVAEEIEKFLLHEL